MGHAKTTSAASSADHQQDKMTPPDYEIDFEGAVMLVFESPNAPFAVCDASKGAASAY